MPNDHQQVASRVRHLLDVAASGAVDPEAAARATDEAAALMQRHSLDSMMLLAARAMPDTLDCSTIHVPGPHSRERAALGAVIAANLGCVTRYTTSATGTGTVLYVFGQVADREWTGVLTAGLLYQGEQAMDLRGIREDTEPARAFWLGYAQRIAARLQEITASSMRQTAGSLGEVSLTLTRHMERIMAYADQALGTEQDPTSPAPVSAVDAAVGAEAAGTARMGRRP